MGKGTGGISRPLPCSRLKDGRALTHGPTREQLFLTRAISEARKEGDLRAAEAMFYDLEQKGILPDIIAYNNLLKACVESQQAGRAEAWMTKLLSSDVKPDITSFNIIIDNCVKTHQDACSAEMWYARMMECGLEPDVVTFCTIINAHARANDICSAVSWLDKMEATGASGSHAYSAVLAACSRQKAGTDWKPVAERTFARLRARKKPDIVAYTAMAQCSARDGDFEAVERLLDEMECNGVKMNDLFLSTLLDSYSRANPKAVDRACGAFIAYAPSLPRLESRKHNLWRSVQECVGKFKARQLWTEIALPSNPPDDATGETLKDESPIELFFGSNMLFQAA